MAELEKTEIKFGAGKIPVFLVWSGPKSGEIAKVLHHYLPLIIHVLEPWMSEEDAKKGARWHSEIAGQLEKAKCGILCMTPENLGSQWIHFEAGALSKITGSLVCPFLIGMKATDLRYPLAVFQNTIFTKEDSYHLIETLNDVCGGLALDSDRLKESFGTYWPKIKSELSEIEKKLAKPTEEKRTEVEVPVSGELIEELVRNSRELLRQISRPEDSATTSVSPLSISQIAARSHRYEIIEGVIEAPFKMMIANEGNELFAFNYSPDKDELSFLIRKPLTESSLLWLDNTCRRVDINYRVDVMESDT